METPFSSKNTAAAKKMDATVSFQNTITAMSKNSPVLKGRSKKSMDLAEDIPMLNLAPSEAKLVQDPPMASDTFVKWVIKNRDKFGN